MPRTSPNPAARCVPAIKAALVVLLVCAGAASASTTATPTPTPTITVTTTGTATVTATGCVTATVSTTATPTVTVSATATVAPSVTVTATVTATAPPTSCIGAPSYCVHGACDGTTGKCDCFALYSGPKCDMPTCRAAPFESPTTRMPSDVCQCKDGWTGFACDVCTSSDACKEWTGLNNSTCVKEAAFLNTGKQHCVVKNAVLQSLLEGGTMYAAFDYRVPDDYFYVQAIATFTDRDGRYDQFYCRGINCSYVDGIKNYPVTYACSDTKCACNDDAFLCSNQAFINIGPVLNTLSGASEITCYGNGTCLLKLPLVYNLVGLVRITCDSGECGDERVVGTNPQLSSNQVAVVAGATTAAVVGTLAILLGLFVYWNQYNKRLTAKVFSEQVNFLENKDRPRLSLSFDNITYSVATRRNVRAQLLHGVSGHVNAGELMAIMGSSGAGKTTLLDILACRAKAGKVGGEVLVNGRTLSRVRFRAISGFVDQEDTLLPRLTVRETVRFAARLKLPRTMPLVDKLRRVESVLVALKIDHVADRFVGSKGQRGISGGEKRRVSIACELVTMPSILLLDEPTSGLDAHSAFVVMDTLKQLAVSLKTAVVCTIHQPRSNIYTMFDKVMLLHYGRVLYSGPHDRAVAYFTSVGQACPDNYNPADFLIDVAAEAVDRGSSTEKLAPPSSSTEEAVGASSQDVMLGGGDAGADGIALAEMGSTSTRARRNEAMEAKFKASDLAARTVEEIAEARRAAAETNVGVSEDRLGWFAQFIILSDRAFTNVYREPFLMVAHYVIALLLGLLMGGLSWQVGDDLAGLQNRLGYVFFVVAIFGLASVSSLELFASERLLFAAERANGYYHPSAFFWSKILFDNLPLRVVPPVLLAFVSYYMVGLNPDPDALGKFILVLVLFNLAAGSFSVTIGSLFRNKSVTNLLASLTMLFSLLFSGFLINKNNIPPVLSWIQYLSFFNYAFEALVVNEMTGILIVDSAAGIDIQVRAEVILEKFGFIVDNYWLDVGCLAIFYAGYLALSFIALKFLIKDRR